MPVTCRREFQLSVELTWTSRLPTADRHATPRVGLTLLVSRLVTKPESGWDYEKRRV